MPTSKAGVIEKSMEDATVAIIASDPELRDELRGLISDATKRYRHVVRWGSPDARLAAIKAIVPGLLRAMGRVEQSEEEAEARAAYERLLKAEVAIHTPAVDVAPAKVVKKAVKKSVAK
jgi:hypothetical protein